MKAAELLRRINASTTCFCLNRILAKVTDGNKFTVRRLKDHLEVLCLKHSDVDKLVVDSVGSAYDYLVKIRADEAAGPFVHSCAEVKEVVSKIDQYQKAIDESVKINVADALEESLAQPVPISDSLPDCPEPVDVLSQEHVINTEPVGVLPDNESSPAKLVIEESVIRDDNSECVSSELVASSLSQHVRNMKQELYESMFVDKPLVDLNESGLTAETAIVIDSSPENIEASSNSSKMVPFSAMEIELKALQQDEVSSQLGNSPLSMPSPDSKEPAGQSPLKCTSVVKPVEGSISKLTHRRTRNQSDASKQASSIHSSDQVDISPAPGPVSDSLSSESPVQEPRRKRRRITVRKSSGVKSSQPCSQLESISPQSAHAEPSTSKDSTLPILRIGHSSFKSIDREVLSVKERYKSDVPSLEFWFSAFYDHAVRGEVAGFKALDRTDLEHFMKVDIAYKRLVNTHSRVGNIIRHAYESDIPINSDYKSLYFYVAYDGFHRNVTGKLPWEVVAYDSPSVLSAYLAGLSRKASNTIRDRTPLIFYHIYF